MSKTKNPSVIPRLRDPVQLISKTPISVSIPTPTPTVNNSTISVVTATPTITAESRKLKNTHYYCTDSPENEVKDAYVKLLNDNLVYLVDYIYANTNKSPFDQAATRSTMSMQMILGAGKLVPFQTASLIAKDLDDLRKDDNYTGQWVNPAQKRKALNKELELLKKHTEIDETMSLNLTDPHAPVVDHKTSLDDFDIHSGLSTLNVSAKYPVQEEGKTHPGCVLM